MMGKRVQREAKLFHVGFNLEDRVPADHPLRRIDQAIDFGFVRPRVAALYGYNGHESIDPVLIVKLMFLCFYENIRSERELMRQLPMRLDWLWFCGLDLDSEIPDHSVLSKARRRWGARLFEELFNHVLRQCEKAGLIGGDTLHADSTLLKASASLEGRVSRKLWEQLEQSSQSADGRANDRDDDADGEAQTSENPGEASNLQEQSSIAAATWKQPPQSCRAGRIKLNERVVSPVDPDAATSTRKAGGTMLGYRDHRLVDDKQGIILATVATAADADDGAMLGELLARQSEYLELQPSEVVGDSMYGTLNNYAELKRRKIKAYLKKRRGKDSPKISWLKQLPAGCSMARALKLLGRRKARAEGSFAEAHTRMNHRRCRWRRQWRVQIQCYLVATVQNVKRLAGLSRGWRRSISYFFSRLEILVLLSEATLPQGCV
jgi:IS5 family transposase